MIIYQLREWDPITKLRHNRLNCLCILNLSHLNVAIGGVSVGDADGLTLPLVRQDDQERHHEPEADAEDGVQDDDDGVLREAVILRVAELHLGHDDEPWALTEYIGDRKDVTRMSLEIRWMSCAKKFSVTLINFSGLWAPTLTFN